MLSFKFIIIVKHDNIIHKFKLFINFIIFRQIIFSLKSRYLRTLKFSFALNTQIFSISIIMCIYESYSGVVVSVIT